MTKIYIVRHCEALGNQMRIFQGTTDLDITETGAKQLEYLKKRFESIKIDRIYTSPLIRTVKTALAVKGDRNIEIEPHEGLIELDGGIVEGKPFKETFDAMPELANIWFNHPQDFAPDGGEPIKNAYNRIWNTVCEIAKENQGKNIVCAAHGGVIRCLNCRLLKNDISELKNIPWSDNTAITLIEFDENLNPNLVYYNDASHLPNDLIPSNSRLSSYTKGVNK